MKHLFSLLIPFAIIPGIVAAQVALGPEVGVNVCNYNTSHGWRLPVGGIRTGIRTDIVLAGHFNVQPGIFYVNNNMGGSHLIGGAYPTMTVRTVEIPLNIVYKARVSRVNTPFIGVGPYMGLNVGGKVTIPPGDMPYPMPTIIRQLQVGPHATDDIKMVDAGLSFIAGLQLANGFYTRVLFQKGLTNLQPQGTTDALLKRMNFGFSLGYLFSAKHKVKPTPEKLSS